MHDAGSSPPDVSRKRGPVRSWACSSEQAKQEGRTPAPRKGHRTDSGLEMRSNEAGIGNSATQTVNFQVCQGRPIAKAKIHD